MQNKILIINFGGIGDQILFFPVVKSVKKIFPECFITLVTESRSRSAVNLTNFIDEVFISHIKSGNTLIEMVKLLVKAFFGKYDTVISSGSSKLIPILLFLTGIKTRIGYDNGILSRILLTKAVPLNLNQYSSDMYHDLVSGFCEDRKQVVPEIDLSIDQEKADYLDNLLKDSSSLKKIVIHPGVSSLSIEKKMIKFWSVNNWLELIKKLSVSGQYSVILTGGPDDRKYFSELNHLNFNSCNFLNLMDKNFSIEEFAYIVKKSDLLVCVDSAPMHIAVGLKKPLAAIFGPTDEHKLLPKNNLYTAIINHNAQCRPCLWDKRQTTCRELLCLNIDPDQVYKVIAEKFDTAELPE